RDRSEERSPSPIGRASGVVDCGAVRRGSRRRKQGSVLPYAARGFAHRGRCTGFEPQRQHDVLASTSAATGTTRVTHPSNWPHRRKLTAMDIDSALNNMRQKHAPTEGDRERVHAALAAALAVSGAAGLVHVATTTGLKGAGLKGTALALPMWVKGSIAIGSLMAAVGGYHGLSAYRNSKETAATVQQFAPLAPAAQGASANTDGHVESRRAPPLERQSNHAAAGQAAAPTAKPVDERTTTSNSRAAHRALASATAASVTAASVTTTSLAE